MLTRALAAPCLAVGALLVGCAPVVVESASKDAAAASDAAADDLGATPFHDDGRGVPSHDVTSPDLPSTVDAGSPDIPQPVVDGPQPVVDVPPPIDIPPPIDVPQCTLPPPAARPPSGGPDGSSVVHALAAEHPDWLQGSCVAMGGDSRFLHEVLRRLRARDVRWGLDRSTGSVAGDVITYFHGDGCPEGRGEAYKFDIIARHCAVPGRDAPAAAAWIDRSSETTVWTLQGFDGTPPLDAGSVRDVPPVATMLPLPDGSGVVRALAAERPDMLRDSCVMSGGNNAFLFEVVRRLRRMDTRWGLNWKRGNVGDMSQDAIDYYYGPGSPREGATEVYIIDMIGGHCGPTPSPAWIDVTEATRMGGTIGRWTLANRTDLGP